MNIKIVKKLNDSGSIACLPLVKNIPEPKSNDWRKVICSECGAECWESDLARQTIAYGMRAACTMCAIKKQYKNK